MREAAETFAIFDKAMAGVYSARSGMGQDEVAELMAGDYWMTGEDAVELGFANTFLASDEVIEDDEKKSNAKHQIDVALAKQGVPRSERRKMFKDLNLDEKYMDAAALELVRNNRNLLLVNLFPSATHSRSLVDEILLKYSNKKISLKCSEKILIQGRKLLIKRCLYNIIDNALKYAGNAQIQVKKNISTIEIIVDDDGPGIPANERERVLRPFYRLDKSRKISDGSVGLGLSIVQDIVNSHGGTVKLNDNPKGRGLRIILTFPA
jgi:signal transduction histidine kinase